MKNGKISNEIKKEELKEPTLLEILNKLRENGIILNMKSFTIDELIFELKGKIKNEKCN